MFNKNTKISFTVLDTGETFVETHLSKQVNPDHMVLLLKNLFGGNPDFKSKTLESILQCSHHRGREIVDKYVAVAAQTDIATVEPVKRRNPLIRPNQVWRAHQMQHGDQS